MEKHIDLAEGDTLVVRVAPSVPVTNHDPQKFMTIGAVNIYQNDNYARVSFLSDLDVCTDGSGPSHGDDYHQSQTAYYSGGRDGGKYMNADKDRYIVVPPQVRSMVPGVVMGCAARVTNMTTKVTSEAVVGDIGPDDKTGECSYCLAKFLNKSITANSGDSKIVYLYELWPDRPATVESFTYKLQPA